LTEFALVLINSNLLLIIDSEFAIVEQIPDGARDFDLSRMRASNLVNEGRIISTDAK